jgi:hypothetical protein
MANDKEIGRKIYKEAITSWRQSNRTLARMEKELASLNRQTSRAARALYKRVLKGLDITPYGTVENNVDNLSKVQILTGQLEPILTEYRMKFGDLIRTFREEVLLGVRDKEERAERQLKRVGITEDRIGMSEENFNILALLNEKNFRKINEMLLKWKNTVYDIFMSGVAKEMDLVSFESQFYNKDGSVRIGSSLEQESVQHAMVSVTEQRTAYTRQKAKENGYTYVWNDNPLDRRTKPICLEASFAGVISEKDMSERFGFPPRFICRCDLVYTRPEWADINEAINDSIRQRKVELAEEILDAPKQVPYWYWKGRKVYPDDIVRMQGNKMYKEDLDKLDLLIGTEVPTFTESKVLEGIWARGATRKQVRDFQEKYGFKEVGEARIKRGIDRCFD